MKKWHRKNGFIEIQKKNNFFNIFKHNNKFLNSIKKEENIVRSVKDKISTSRGIVEENNNVSKNSDLGNGVAMQGVNSISLPEISEDFFSKEELDEYFSDLDQKYVKYSDIGEEAGDIPILGENGLLVKTIIPRITSVGVITKGTWEGNEIDSSFIEEDLSGKTYNGLNLVLTQDGLALRISSNVTLDQD